jgi:hypothetical protein
MLAAVDHSRAREDARFEHNLLEKDLQGPRDPAGL